MRTLIAGGGTGGHLTPALALAVALRSSAADAEVVVVGRHGGVAERLVTDAGLRLVTLDVSGADSGSVGSMARAAARLPRATLAARRLLRQMDPDVVVGSGGYVSVPVVVAAMARQVPVVLLEQNALPGRATRMLARRAHAVAASFAQTASLLPHARVVHTGNPIRAEVRALLGAQPGERIRNVLVTGGSQGARRINRAVSGCIRALLETDAELTVAHQCGTLDHDAVMRGAASLPPELAVRYEVSPFFDDMGSRMARSDLVVMRAGGSSLAECAALGRPMILVPYPHAGDHQRHNAAPYVHAGAALLVEDEDCTPERLIAEITNLAADPERRLRMAAASAAVGMPDAADSVVRLVLDAAASRRHRNAA